MPFKHSLGRVARTMEWAQLPPICLWSGDGDRSRASKVQHAVESAATAIISKDTDVFNGSPFIYFETKAALLNQLHIELKTEMAVVAMGELPSDSDDRSRLIHMWRRWLYWAVSCPEKRRALAHLSVSDGITAQSRMATRQAMLGIVALVERSRKTGSLRNASSGFVSALMSAMADTTMDFMISDPSSADTHCMTAFEGLWRMLA